jgi:heavy metal translocating P-type ATPase
MTFKRWIDVSRIVVTGLVTLFYACGWVWEWVLLVAVIAGLYPLLKIGLIDLIRRRRLSTEIFVSLATIIAVATGEAIAGAVIMVIILIAEFISTLNTERARNSIRNLIGSAPSTATRLVGPGQLQEVQISELRPGDVVLVRAGEKIPVDGAVIGGDASVNEAPITGESIPRDKTTGSTVFAGTVVASGALDVRTEKIGSDTTVARIVQLVENAQEHQAPVQKLTDTVAAWLIPVVLVFLALIYFFTRDARLIVTLLIFTSPAELGLATPLVMIAAIARAAHEGILVKGGIYLELLAKVDVIVFDKTGTLTTGEPTVTAALPAPGVSHDQLVQIAAAADQRSSHPLALAVINYAAKSGISYPDVTDFQTMQGRGVTATVDGQKVLLGTELLLHENGIDPPDLSADKGQTHVYAAVDGKALGVLYFADRIRAEAASVITQLKATGVDRIVMLTGDNLSTAQTVAAELGIDEIHGNLLPQGKVDAIRKLQQEGHRVAMVGDGINDGPALAAAEVGVAMGGTGTQVAIEAADVALMTDDLGRIVLARTIARRAYRTIKENLIFGIGVVHIAGISAALLGLIGPIEAALLHLGPDVMVFLNSVKLLRVRLDHRRLEKRRG